MVDEDLGQATIVYDDPDEGTIERTVQNEHIAYFQDHWTVKAGEDDQGRDVVRRIPHHRVHYVERTVDEFEEEVRTIQRRIQSFADDLRSTFLGGEDDDGLLGDASEETRAGDETGRELPDDADSGRSDGETSGGGVHHIDVTDESADE